MNGSIPPPILCWKHQRKRGGAGLDIVWRSSPLSLPSYPFSHLYDALQDSDNQFPMDRLVSTLIAKDAGPFPADRANRRKCRPT